MFFVIIGNISYWENIMISTHAKKNNYIENLWFKLDMIKTIIIAQ
jgi:hypothetical protein